jgi:hypothetical protein
MAEHVRRQRLARPVPSAFMMPGSPDLQPQSEPAGRAPLGHNSRGVDIEAEERQEAGSTAPRRDLDVGALVARATRIQAAHVALRRRGLTITTFKPEKLTQTPDSK